MNTRTITAMFDDKAEAQRAAEALEAEAGIAHSAIRVNAGAAAGQARADDKGFFALLHDLFVPDDDRQTYAEGLRRGAVLVSAQVEDANVERAMDVLEKHEAVDLDARKAEWRGGGTTTADRASTVGADATEVHAPGEESIALVEEQLHVGKREVERGRVRVRSYVVETPVEEQVTLRSESVQVERRPVDRPLTDADAAAFQDRTIEATETREEAVVAKEARVTEELVVTKTADDRTQTVSDTVRHTEVDVEDSRGAKPGSTGSATETATVSATTLENPPARRR